MKIGLCTLSSTDRSVEQIIELAAAVGYVGVEIRGKRDDDDDSGHVGDGSVERCREIVRTATEHGIEIPVYGSYLRLGSVEAGDRIESELDIAHAIGADLIRVWPGEQEYDGHDDDHWEDVLEQFGILLEGAVERDLGVTIEKHAGRLTNTAEGAKRLVEEIDDARCLLNYQPMFDLPAKELVVEAERLAPLSNNVHIQAVPERGGSDRCLLEEAYFDVEAILEPFDRRDFEGYVTVEFVTDAVPYRTALERDLEFLRSIVG